jgi:hypothetical protein
MLPILEAECVTESAGGDIGRVFRTLQRARYLQPLCVCLFPLQWAVLRDVSH